MTVSRFGKLQDNPYMHETPPKKQLLWVMAKLMGSAHSESRDLMKSLSQESMRCELSNTAIKDIKRRASAADLKPCAEVAK